jgi:hypothetical protein
MQSLDKKACSAHNSGYIALVPCGERSRLPGVNAFDLGFNIMLAEVGICVLLQDETIQVVGQLS